MYEGYNKELLISRIKELEEQVEHLRISRRVLMNLIEKIEREKRLLLTRLEKENRRLQQNNAKYANWLWNKNRIIIELESKIHQEN
ncbi:MAG: translation initiation factor 2 [Peptococcaceae bacterium BICA1-8]|nr:MAG: translation initiation factor 2 [Clostridiaceae bacterium BRH_c20a]KJS87891.1 MAG: translation initiation factor 2 [Peptococcaceae bacterium BICA1-8]